MFYIKENNQYMSDFNAKFSYSATLSVGFNL